ncbi:LytR family transcriptional regulator [Streptomyces chrestomyceticus JCM 4735]|uniref:LytR family transcriptional regulator n=1 Tax=Streptomyces chrestomyceticus JCM 4735 TaxID=1306181 RepID=A0A7U9KZ57_9ACTN|nr:LCP family protein [Streptomyces chrestomyceticus]GCD37248.1 LytR family transcriptional regulator [Streptomyces chrestomyceticus JCM 4735]
MDAQGRGRGDDIDPADQWVFDPNTGTYELRLDPGDAPATQPAGRKGPAPGRGRGTPRPEGGTPAPGGGTGQPGGGSGRPGSRTGQNGSGSGAPGRDTDTRELPAQRDRRAGNRSAPPGGGAPSRRKPKPKKSTKKKALYWTSGALGFVLVAGCGGAFFLYQQLNGNISKVDVGKENPAVKDGPVNILVIGTDARSGKGNQGYGDAGSVGHADTTILMHISKDRSNATALSIPRDMITDIPDCPTKKDGATRTIPGQHNVRFNTSLGQEDRDPGCTWRTVEKMTGLSIDHFMMADFNAVKELSEAVDGVEVCAAKPIDDPKSHLHLPAGKSVVKGEQALAFVRTRHSVGTGSDLSRIQLQQQFLSSMIRKMKSGDTLTSVPKLYDLAQAATKALTVDTGIGSAGKLVDLAKDLSRVDIKNITFATVPVLDNPKDPATVVLDEAKAGPLFQMIRADHSLSKTKEKKSKGTSDDKKVPKAPADKVRVDVSNGGGPIGAAQETVDWLQNSKAAKLSTNAGNAPTKLAATRLEYAPNQADQAAALADWMGLPKSALKKTTADAGPKVPMKLILGKDFKGPGKSIEAPTKTPDGVQNVNADDQNICAK